VEQGIAVTGSVNQKGRIQAIGGVNQKIEGFFEVCKTKGLTGRQGVMIPKSNVKNLMLKREVV
ncbi:MAG: ATP-dependent peptidase, partial [Desulfobacteraceae bacterium]